MYRPLGSRMPSPIFWFSEDDKRVVTGPPARSEARIPPAYPYETRCPSWKKCTQQTGPLGKSRRVCCPSDDINHVSSSGSLFFVPKFVPNAIVDPSGETSQA